MIRCSGNENLKKLDREIASEYRAATKIEQNLSSVNRPENLPTQVPTKTNVSRYERFLTSSLITWSCENQNILKSRNITQKSATLTETVLNLLQSTTSVPRQLLNHDRHRPAQQVPLLAQKIQGERSRKLNLKENQNKKKSQTEDR